MAKSILLSVVGSFTLAIFIQVNKMHHVLNFVHMLSLGHVLNSMFNFVHGVFCFCVRTSSLSHSLDLSSTAVQIWLVHVLIEQEKQGRDLRSAGL